MTSSLNPAVNDLISRIKADAGISTQAEADLLTAVTLDSTKLAAAAATGADVSREVPFIKATLLNFEERKRNIIAYHLTTFFTNVVSGVISRALLVG